MQTQPIIHQHGPGDLDAIERNYGIPKSEILDFSGNINPLGFPQSVKTALSQNLDSFPHIPTNTIPHYAMPLQGIQVPVQNTLLWAMAPQN